MPTSASDDEDALLDSLENETESDPSFAHLRESRIQALSSDLKRQKQQRSEGYGTYVQVRDEKALMDITTGQKRCIVHFYKPDFNRCRIMDEHLSSLAGTHLETRFLRIDVEHAPFLVTKLGVKILPCVICFVDGVSKDRIVGFDGVGYSEDTFQTKDLEDRLIVAGVIEKGVRIANGSIGSFRGRERSDVSDINEKAEPKDEDDDWV